MQSSADCVAMPECNATMEDASSHVFMTFAIRSQLIA
jgi:hypothetical protein